MRIQPRREREHRMCHDVDQQPAGPTTLLFGAATRLAATRLPFQAAPSRQPRRARCPDGEPLPGGGGHDAPPRRMVLPNKQDPLDIDHPRDAEEPAFPPGSLAPRQPSSGRVRTSRCRYSLPWEARTARACAPRCGRPGANDGRSTTGEGWPLAPSRRPRRGKFKPAVAREAGLT